MLAIETARQKAIACMHASYCFRLAGGRFDGSLGGELDLLSDWQKDWLKETAERVSVWPLSFVFSPPVVLPSLFCLCPPLVPRLHGPHKAQRARLRLVASCNPIISLPHGSAFARILIEFINPLTILACIQFHLNPLRCRRFRVCIYSHNLWRIKYSMVIFISQQVRGRKTKKVNNIKLQLEELIYN